MPPTEHSDDIVVGLWIPFLTSYHRTFSRHFNCYLFTSDDHHHYNLLTSRSVTILHESCSRPPIARWHNVAFPYVKIVNINSASRILIVRRIGNLLQTFAFCPSLADVVPWRASKEYTHCWKMSDVSAVDLPYRYYIIIIRLYYDRFVLVHREISAVRSLSRTSGVPMTHRRYAILRTKCWAKPTYWVWVSLMTRKRKKEKNCLATTWNGNDTTFLRFVV